MDLYIVSVVLGVAGMAAMAFLGFSSSHGGAHYGHDTSGHQMHGVAGTHGHSVTAAHGVPHGPSHQTVEQIGGKNYQVTQSPIALGHGELHPISGWRSHLWSWLSPRVLFNILVGFGATGLSVERLIGPVSRYRSRLSAA
jgi:hypothetical protein